MINFQTHQRRISLGNGVCSVGRSKGSRRAVRLFIKYLHEVVKSDACEWRNALALEAQIQFREDARATGLFVN